jgi:hypothetical protein
MNRLTAQKTRERQAEILSRLSAGDSLRRICAETGMPAPATVCGWVNQSEAFAKRYRKARRCAVRA